MSSPDSTIEVETSTSRLPPRKRRHDPRELALGHLAVADADAGLGHQPREPGRDPEDALARGCARRRPARRGPARGAPPRRRAPARSARSVVWMASRFSGGVATSESSRSPESARCSVRGIGVAVRVSTSTCARSRLSASLWRTPKRCSSSMISRPRSGKTMSFPTMRCVPIRMSTSPAASAASDPALLLRRRRSG